MKKNALVIGIIFLLVAMNIVITNAQEIKKSTISGNWLYVGGSGPGNYSKIQDAIDNASIGDTIFVFSGTYIGYVIINKSINLIGEDKNTTIIIGFFAYTISIVSDWVNMSGFTIKNGDCRGEGIRIDSSFNNFSNTIIDIPNDRIRVSGNKNNIYGNTIKNTYIYLSGDNNNIFCNNITNTYYGLYLIDSSDNIIFDNSFFNCGLFISFDTYRNNIVANNTINGKPLVYLDEKSNIVLDVEAGQIIILNCTNITIKNKEIFNTFVGIQIWESDNCIIFGNNIAGSYFGIWLSGFNNKIYENSVENNYCGISFSGNNNTISANTITNSSGDGIYLTYSDHNNIINNLISNNYCSLQLDYGNDFNDIVNNTITKNNNAIVTLSGNYNNNFAKNTIRSNQEGIALFFSYYNNITNNLIENNNETGIYINNGGFNNIIDNNITDNKNGLYALRFENNTIKGNNIVLNNLSGIYLNFSSNNIISDNSIFKNKQGLYFFSSNNNIIFKNNFLKNKRHAFFENSTNTWNKNFWGRPKILPKFIFGVRNLQINTTQIIFNIDWHPAKKLNEDPEIIN